MTDLASETPAAVARLEKSREWKTGGIIFFGLLALILLYAAFRIIEPFITAIALGLILVILTFPLFKRVRSRTRNGSSTLAAAIMLIGITFLIFVPAIVLAFMLVNQANTVVEHMQSGDAQRLLKRIDLTPYLAFVRRFVPSFDPATLSPERLLLPAVKMIPGWIARNGAALLGGLAGMVLGFFMVLLSSFFFYVSGEVMLRELAVISPLPQRYDIEFAEKFKDVIDATFLGQLMTALAQGIATGIGLAIAGVPGSILWGSVSVVLSLVPMVGAAAVWVPASIYLFVASSMGDRPVWQPIFLVVWGVLVVSLIDNIVRPWAMAGKAQLPAIPLLFAVLGGLQAFGFVGLVVGPLVFSLLMTIIDIYKRSFRLGVDKAIVA